MEWLNLKTSTLHAPEYIGSEPRARAAWLNVSLWCAQQENGGRIDNARGWKDRQWQQTCGVTRREVDSANRLLTWDGDTLKVWNYPADKEQIVRERREIGRSGGLKSGAVRGSKPLPTVEADGKHTVEPNGEANASTERKGIGKEGEEERNLRQENTSYSPCPTSAPPTSDVEEVAKKKAAAKTAKDAADAAAMKTGEKFVDWFLGLLRETEAPEPKLTPSTRAGWARAYVRMIHIDKRTKEEVKEVCQWARNEPFWRQNFLSPVKLRLRNNDGVMWFDVFLARARSPREIPGGARNQAQPVRVMQPLPEVTSAQFAPSLLPPEAPSVTEPNVSDEPRGK